MLSISADLTLISSLLMVDGDTTQDRFASLVYCLVGSSVNLIDYTAVVVVKLISVFAANESLEVLLINTFSKGYSNVACIFFFRFC